MENTSYRAIAIVGAGAILPDAPNVAAFWENIKNGRYSVTQVDPERWDPALYYDPDPSTPDKTYSKIGGWVREYPWEPMKWHLPIPPRVANAMDVSQKWAIACTREALEDYGYPKRPLDPDRTAVILGNALGGEKHYFTALRIYFPEYARELAEAASFAALPEALRRDITRELHDGMDKHLPEITEDSMPGELANCIAGRIANIFNFHGPNYVCDAACASAMAAISSAIEGLVENDYDAVVSGGIDRNMGASTFVKFCKIGALSATGTRPYAQGADGFVMGEGSAIFVLKRLADAERDGDKIYAVLRGMGGASDGKGKGITAPNPIGQKLAIERAWQNAGLSPATATYIEGHGTSTRVGDVVEVQSMADVLSSAHLPPRSVALGSVKSNFGHLKGAAGAAGLLKTILALRDKVLPPSVHCEHPNPDIDFAHSPLYVNTQLKPWTATADGVRRAGLSAFGFGGTNFHAVLEEYIPHRLNGNGKRWVAVSAIQPPVKEPIMNAKDVSPTSASSYKTPLRGALVLGGASETALIERLRAVEKDTKAGRAPALTPPAESDLRAPERLAIDYADAGELAEKAGNALKALAANQPALWKALRAQGIFRGHGPAPKVAFLYPGQGSQYVNMLKPLRAVEPIVAETFAEADRIMTPLLGKPLSEFVFVDKADADAVAKAEDDLRQTAITQPAVLATDLALTRLLAAYGITPDFTMGHSLGEYGALLAADALPFADALEAVSARGREMTRFAPEDKGRMAAVFAPLEEIERILKTVTGYVVIANVNSNRQAVIGGASKAVEQAMEAFQKAGYDVSALSVSHAFHTTIVASASEPLRRVLQRLRLASPRLPIVANTSGEFYPMGPDVVPQMLDILALQVAAPVQFVKGLRTLYEAGARIFVEVGPKKALQGFAEDVLGERGDVVSVFTNHPKVGDVPAFNQALCCLYAAGLGRGIAEAAREAGFAPAALAPPETAKPIAEKAAIATAPVPPISGDHYVELGRLFADVLERGWQITHGQRHAPVDQPVAITGAALGLPGTEHIFDDSNIARILRGDQFIDTIPTRFRRAMLDKHITRLVKNDNGGTFETINSVADVIKLAGRGGTFDLENEFGVSAERVAALDRDTQLAIAVGLDALRDAGIPLVQRYKTTTKGTQLPDRWALPDALRDDTGVIFGSAFPGLDSFADETARYYADHGRRDQLAMLQSLRARMAEANGDSILGQEIDRRIEELCDVIDKEPYVFDRRYLFRVLSMGHSQFAEFIGARGPNTQINSACATTTQAVTLAEDWIHAGRCRRVIVISADDVTTDHLIDWMGAGFLASGAAATDEVVEEAAVPFDRRRHGMIIGMGAAALVVESAEAARERGLQPICEVLSTVTANSAFHGTRLDVQHIGQVMEDLVSRAEARSGIRRQQIAPQTVFISHETYTPARGGSAAAEIHALRRVFGDTADKIVIANTKGFTGHAMGAGVEDVLAVKALETGLVPPVANFKEVDPELGALNLSKGGAYPVEYALRLGAGFGSQISMTLLHWVTSKDRVRRSPNALGYAYRIADTNAWNAWLSRMAGHPAADLEVVHRTLRVRDHGPAARRADAAPELRAVPAPVPPLPAMPPTPVFNTRLPDTKPVTGLPTESPEPQLKAQAAAFAPRAAVLTPPAAKQEVEVRSAAPATTLTPINSDNPGSSVKERILALMVEKTGYPQDMLDLDLDLEADLGVDTVKQAEMFAAIREIYNIPRDENRKLRDYPTLAHVIRFVYEKRPDLASTAPLPAALQATEEIQPIAPATVVVPPKDSTADSVKERILALAVEKTGYPKDMLDLDLDLEADLGVDTVKQAEMFAAIREIYSIPRDENRKLRDYPTLAHVMRFVYEKRPDLAAVAPSTPTSVEAPTPAPAAAVTQAATDGSIKQKVLGIAAEKTGYPKDMLDLDLDLEADLGIDTVKQAEMFAAIRAAYNIPRDENLKLRDFPTLAHVIKFAQDRSGLVKASAPAAAQEKRVLAEEKPSSSLAPALAKSARPALASLDAANRIPRRVPLPILRPALNLCKPTGVALERSRRVVIMPDKNGVADALTQLLQKRGVEVLRTEDAPDADALTNRLRSWMAAGPVHGVYWLPALDSEGKLRDLELSTWHEAVQVRVKSLYSTMRALYEPIAQPGTFLMSATRLGGQHGYDEAGAVAPLGGAVVGFSKAYKRERPDALVKAVDFEAERKPSEVAEFLIEETLRDPGAVEIGYKAGLRWTIGLQEQPAADGEPGLTLDENTVFLITGAAGSIVSAITADLAAASGGTFFLLDLVPEPDPGNPDLKRFASDKEGLKRDLFARIQARGERATPALVEKELAVLERAQAARSAIDAVSAAGGTPHYFSVNLTDAEGVGKVIEQVRERSGHIDVLLHAAGVERSHSLPDKDQREFDLVFDVKSDGFFNLLRAIGDMPLQATVAFSSIAGRFGNAGQTDYSSANDLLCKITSNFRATRPSTRGIAIDWTAWGGIGMATRGSIPKVMELAGIDMLPPEAGIPLIRRELTAGGTRGEIVVGQRLGVLLNEFDPTGGLDVNAAEASAEKRSPAQGPVAQGPMQGPMIGKIASAGLYSPLTIETTLDPAIQPFLHDHQIDGTPVLPGVMGIEAFAEAALCLVPGWHVESVEEVNFLAPFKFYRNEPRPVTVEAVVHPHGDALIADCRLLGHRTLPNQTAPQVNTHFTARVRLTKHAPALVAGPALSTPEGHVIEATDIYRLFFHGPAYQVVERAWWDGKRIVGLMANGLPYNHHPSCLPALMAPRWIELCFQTAGVWEMGGQGRMGLPQHIDRVSLLVRDPQRAEGRLYAVVTPNPREESFDAEVVDAKGNRYLQLSGYRTVEIPNAVDAERLKELQAAMSLEAVVA
jgi:acyl transferase domain-containing protein/NAD(P)-dependent dehydrogenase (short-subunit alcohol dehydrogenase family)